MGGSLTLGISGPTGTAANGYTQTLLVFSGSANFTLVIPDAATYAITVSYSGDQNNAPSSATVIQVVNLSTATPTSTALQGLPNPVFSGQTLTLTARVSPILPAATTPSGTVSFYEGGTKLGTGSVGSNGQATFCPPLPSRSERVAPGRCRWRSAMAPTR